MTLIDDVTWDGESALTRQHEKTYHNLNISTKELYLKAKYFTPYKEVYFEVKNFIPDLVPEQVKYLIPQNGAHLYLTYMPNLKELGNNALWRLGSDIFLGHYYKGITDPLTKESAYAVSALAPAFTAALFEVKIGSSNNNFTWTHFAYAAVRASGKALPLVIFADKRNIKGALDADVKAALYFTDTALRWIPYSNERLQSDNKTNIYSAEFYTISVLSGAARIAGPEYISPFANDVQILTENIITNFVLNELDLIDQKITTLDKIYALGDILIKNAQPLVNPNVTPILTNPALVKIIEFSGSVYDASSIYANNVASALSSKASQAVQISIEYTTIPSEYIAPFIPKNFFKDDSGQGNALYNKAKENTLFLVFSIIIPTLYFLQTTSSHAIQTAVKYTTIPREYLVLLAPKFCFKNKAEGMSLDDAVGRGAGFLAKMIALDVIILISKNIIGTFILQPASRIFGIFMEEGVEYLFAKTKEISGSISSKVTEVTESIYSMLLQSSDYFNHHEKVVNLSGKNSSDEKIQDDDGGL